MILFYAAMARNTCSWLIAVFMLSVASMPVSSDDIAYSESLLKFKESLTNASMLSNWLEPVENLCLWDTPVWTGCLCVNDSLVGLRLEGMGLGGTIDGDALSEVPMVSLSVMYNNFTGPFPESIKKLGKLRSLYFAYNGFSGEIPKDAFEGMYALRKVVLGDNSFTGRIPVSLLWLPKLSDLEIQNNMFEGRIPDFWQANLTVNFANNNLHGAIPSTLRYQSANSFSGNANLCGKPLDPCKSKWSTHRIEYIVAGVVGVAILFFIILFFIHRRRAKTLLRKKSSDQEANKDKEGKDKRYRKHENEKLYFVRKDGGRFELEELLRASANVLESDGFGSSFKAALSNGQSYVVRRFKQMSDVGRTEFFDHMRKLGKLSHCNLQPLVAFYYRKEEKLLIMDFVQNGTLASYLHDKRSSNQTRLDWPTRLRIIKGVARGLSYLHRELPTLTLPHGHLKSSNVLLNSKYEPILSDYALAPLINKDRAPQLLAAYKSPDSKQVTRKTDVWSLGILILELLTGRFPPNYLTKPGKGRGADLATWVSSILKEEWSGEVFDKDMNAGRRYEGAMLKLLKIGMCCSDRRVERRWGFGEAVGRIEELKERENGDNEYSSYTSEGDAYSSRVETDDDLTIS